VREPFETLAESHFRPWLRGRRKHQMPPITYTAHSIQSRPERGTAITWTIRRVHRSCFEIFIRKIHCGIQTKQVHENNVSECVRACARARARVCVCVCVLCVCVFVCMRMYVCVYECVCAYRDWRGSHSAVETQRRKK
jgi:hypothetical protein